MYTIEDAFNQVPDQSSLEEFPDIKIKGKNIVIRLPDSLLDNTTYTIQFGESIADITEGNPYSQFVYAFSTGEVIDSLYINGTVTDIWTGKPAANGLVLLYRNTEDSAFTTQNQPILPKPMNGETSGSVMLREVDTISMHLGSELQLLMTSPMNPLAFLDSSLLVSQPIEQADLNLFTEARQKPYVSDARSRARLGAHHIQPGTRQPPVSNRTGSRRHIYSVRSDTLYHWSQVAETDSQRIRISAREMDTFLVIPKRNFG